MKFGGFILLVALSTSIFAISTSADSWDYKVACTGKWKIKFKKNNLTKVSTGALFNGLESDPDGVELTVKTKVADPHWKISVKRIDANWPDGLKLYVRRTGGPGEIVDYRQGYRLIKETEETNFFTGDLDEAKKIPIQFKLNGLASVLPFLNPKTTLETEIIYTITETDGSTP